ncbi:MAG: cation-translocating P-type ATPase [Planctomycetaceae bacterium]|nr:cation-translocating P-type ATPase [Planctomycetaceae bacterium]
MSDSSISRTLCDYCRLPIPRAWWSNSAPPSSREPQYCCLGCRVAAQITAERSPDQQSRALLTRLGIAIFLSMNVMVFTLALWSQDVYGFDLGDQATATLTDLFRYISLLFTIPVLFLLGQPLVVNAIQSTLQGRPSTDLLISVGILSAFGYSAVTVFRGEGHLYFEVVCMVLVLVTLGRWIEAVGRQKANASLDQLEELIPPVVQKLNDDTLVETARDEIQPGDLIRVFPGERIPLDGEVISGQAHVDQQILTGESELKGVDVGQAVYSGSLLLDHSLTLRVTAAPREDTLARMLEIVRQARLQKGRYARLADRVATLFFPLVVIIAVAATIWHGTQTGWELGLMSGLSVLLVSCPCALGLATPLAIWNAMSRATRAQVLFRNGDALEQLARIDTICFDKTGTLTTGETQLTSLIPTDATTTAELRQAAISLAEHSSHPLCRAILADESAPSISRLTLTDVAQIPGKGVSGRAEDSGESLLLGNQRWMHEQGVMIPSAFESQLQDNADDGLLVYVAQGQRLLGAMSFAEELRPETETVLSELRSQSLSLEVLTGDRQQRATSMANTLQIPVQGELLPDEKAKHVQQRQAQRHRVLMVGDGVNDAPALTAADVGLTFGGGTDLARDSAGICLLGNDLAVLPCLIDLSRQTMRTVRWNLFWAFGYNVGGIALAAAGQLNPVISAILMFGSSLFVITNSLRIPGFEDRSDAQERETSTRETTEERTATPTEESSSLETVTF